MPRIATQHLERAPLGVAVGNAHPEEHPTARARRASRKDVSFSASLRPISAPTAPMPPAATDSATGAATQPVAILEPAAANAAIVAARLVPSTRPRRRSVSGTGASRGVG